MPNIKTYTAPPASLTESDKGGQAWSQAGRRLGPLYNEAAQFMRESGKLAADNKAQLWPFDILELYQRQQAAAARAGGGGVRVRGSIDQNSAFGGYGDPGMGNGQVSQGAAALGQALSDGGQAMSQKPRQKDPNVPAGAPGEDYTLDQGNIVTMSAARKAMQKYNSDAEDALNKYYYDPNGGYNNPSGLPSTQIPPDAPVEYGGRGSGADAPYTPGSSDRSRSWSNWGGSDTSSTPVDQGGSNFSPVSE